MVEDVTGAFITYHPNPALPGRAGGWNRGRGGSREAKGHKVYAQGAGPNFSLQGTRPRLRFRMNVNSHGWGRALSVCVGLRKL